MADKLASGQGIVSSLRGTLSDRSKAKSLAMKEKFDPMNIAKFLTGGSNLAPALVGRLTGRSKEDIGYFTGKKRYQYTPRQSSYWQNWSNPNMGGSRKSTEVLEKIVSFMEKSREDDIKEQETLDSYNELNEHLREDNHREVMNVFNEAIKNKRKAMKEMAKEAKKRQAEEKAKDKAQKKAETTSKAEPAKAEPVAPKPAQPAPAQPAPAPTAKPVTTAPPAPTATPTPPLPSLSTAAKVATGAAAGGVAVGSIVARIKSKEGFQGKAYHDPKKDSNGKIIEDRYSVGYGHQITPQEVKQGYIKLGETTVPVVGNLGKDTVITEPQASLLITQDYEKYERAANKITNFDKLGPEAQMAFRDMTYNMGEGWFNPQKWPKLHEALTNLDMNAAAESIANSLYYKQTGKRAKENVELIRKSSTNKLVNEDGAKTPGNIINQLSKENVDMKKDMTSSGAVVAPIVNQNNITNKQRTVTVTSSPIEELNPRMRR
jgi:GH24 family phage-related lysozyme (muramidase)